MKVLNLFYDRAFKYVMDNDRMAKIVLSIILDANIVALESKPTETVIEDKGAFPVLRFDFKAIIETKSGENKVILIELQKYKSKNPIVRFRNYLAKNYMHRELVKNPTTGKQEERELPIISVYILGYDLPEFTMRTIYTKNIPFDIITGKQIKKVNSEYVDLLTHSSIILIAADKPDIKAAHTQLEKFLNLFIQKLKGEDANYIIDLEEKNTDKTKDRALNEIISFLNRGTLDEKLIRQLDYEKEQALKREAEAQKERELAQKEKNAAMQKLAIRI